MLSAFAKMDILRDESIDLYEKCSQLTRIAKVSDEYENIGYYDLQGNGYTAAGQKIQLKRAYIDAAGRGETYIAEPAINPVTNILFQIYPVPVFNSDNKPIGCISANVMGDVLSKRIEQISFGTSDSHVQVVSRKSRHTVASNHFEQILEFQDVNKDADEGIKPVLAKLMASEVGSDSFVNPANGMKMLAAYLPVPGTDWSVLGVCGYDDFYYELSRMSSIIGTLAIIMLVIAFVSVGATMSISLKPLKNIKNAVEDVASGDYFSG